MDLEGILSSATTLTGPRAEDTQNRHKIDKKKKKSERLTAYAQTGLYEEVRRPKFKAISFVWPLLLSVTIRISFSW